ncbi:HAD family phosphatase [Candidatus Woesearchaeota archaeon]|nr:HAD family phosphatase [Candidatus Woesearchaeota archaeon]
MGFKAVLFDFDGVIADTGEDNFNAWKAAMDEEGVSIESEEYFALEGLGPGDVARVFCERHGIPEEHSKKIAEKKAMYYSRNNRFRLFPGAAELVSGLKNEHFLLGLVTGASEKRLRETMPKQVLEKFDVIIASESTSARKPSPEPYVLAAKKLGVADSDCVVVENAPLGVTSAKNAGMFCIAVCSTQSKEQLADADLVVSKLDDLDVDVFRKGL